MIYNQDNLVITYLKGPCCLLHYKQSNLHIIHTVSRTKLYCWPTCCYGCWTHEQHVVHEKMLPNIFIDLSKIDGLVRFAMSHQPVGSKSQISDVFQRGLPYDEKRVARNWISQELEWFSIHRRLVRCLCIPERGESLHKSRTPWR